MRLFIWILLLFLLSIFSCKEKPRMILNEDRHLVDSAYLARIDSVKLIIDSICNRVNSEEYGQALDSIIEIRIAEVQQLQNRR